MTGPPRGGDAMVSWRCVIAGITSIAAGAATALAGWAQQPALCGAAAILCSFALLYFCVISQGGNVASLVGVFCCFHILYGLSGPLAVMLGADLRPIFPGPYAPLQFLVCYGLATAAFSFGLLLTAIRTPSAPESGSGWSASPSLLGALAVLAAFSSSLMEVVNVARVGGLGVLLEGKAAYQSSISDLTGTLPSELAASAAAALIGLAVGREATFAYRRTRMYLVGFLVGIAPLLAAALMLGRRGLIVNWIVSAMLAYSFAGRVVPLRRRFIAVAVSVYVAMGIVYANRSFVNLAIATGDWLLVAKAALSGERMVIALNPAANEFGAPFGNFSEYVHGGPQPLALGATYLRSLILPIPRSVYPGPKPPQVGVEFRDRFFPLTAKEGSVAGTAYSSILEAYVNFGIAGPSAVYCILALVLGRIERWRRTRPTPPFGVLYGLLGSGVISFHRSDLADSLVITVILGSGLAFAVWVALEVASFGSARGRLGGRPDRIGESVI